MLYFKGICDLMVYMKKLFSLILFINFFTAICFAEETEFSEKARTRQYSGGADESDLKVQQQVSAETKKTKVETTDPEDEEGF